MNLLTGRINNYLHSIIIVSSNGGSQTGFNCQKKKKKPMGPKMVIVTNLGSVARKLYNIVTTLK